MGFGDRMVRSWNDMNQGSRTGKERSSWLQVGPEEPCPEGDRASADLKSYFDTIPHEGLMERVGEKIADSKSIEPDQRDASGRSHGQHERMASDRAGKSARSGNQSTIIKYLPQRSGLENGPSRLGNGQVRRRLRNILRHQNKRKGRVQKTDHHRWPNSYFTAAGLYSLKRAHAVACRSS